MGIFRKTYCHCGSGLERGFCSHRGATAAGTVHRAGKATARRAAILAEAADRLCRRAR